MKSAGSPFFAAVPQDLVDRSADRFWAKVDGIGDCWLWTGTKDRAGYGRFHVAKGFGWKMAHRVAYQLLVGEIPNELTLDHLCRVHGCVNPDHLQPCPLGENVRRSHKTRLKPARERSSCLRGHPYTEATKRLHGGSPNCRVCDADDARERRRRKSASRVRVVRTACQRGHQYTAETTYVDPKRGERHCRICKRDRERRARSENKDSHS